MGNVHKNFGQISKLISSKVLSSGTRSFRTQ
nr:MAG TPA: hypothetical protein [Caudoviricetes sp.]